MAETTKRYRDLINNGYSHREAVKTVKRGLWLGRYFTICEDLYFYGDWPLSEELENN